jgi:GTP-binding protein HflX
LESLQNAAERSDNTHITSALTGAGVPEFLDAVSKRLTPDKTQSQLVLDFDKGRARAWLFEQGLVSQEKQTQEGFSLSISWTARQKKAFTDQFGPKLVSGS